MKITETVSSQETNKSDIIKRDFPEILYNSAGFRKAACKKAGISRDTFYRWYKDPEFKKVIDQVDEELIDKAESRLLINIEKGKETSLIFFLKNKAPKKWRDVHELEIIPPQEKIKQVLEAIKNESISKDGAGVLQEQSGTALPSNTGTK